MTDVPGPDATHPVLGLDDVVHQRVRLGILTVTHEARRVEFGYLRTQLELTAGNLSKHLSVLEEAGLIEGEKGHQGRRGRAAIVDGASHLAMMVHGMLDAGRWRDERHANLTDGGMPFYDVYETADGGYLAVGPIEPKFLGELLDRLGLPGADRASPERLRAALSAAFAARTRDEWTEVFAGTDACVAPVLSWREAPHHPHLAARGTFETRHGVRQPAAAPRFSGTPPVPGTPPPRPGEHDAEVLADWGVGG